jgi:hypothetical protein
MPLHNPAIPLSPASVRARAASNGPLCSGRQRFREDCGGAAGGQGQPEPVQCQGEIVRGEGGRLHVVTVLSLAA